MRKIKLTLPIYITMRKKKKDVQVLVGMNAYRNLHFYTKNKWKQHYNELVQAQLKEEDIVGHDNVFTSIYTLYYKNTATDNPNVCAIIEKFTTDALIKYGVVKNDNVTRHKRQLFVVGGQDKENPRVEVEVTLNE